MKKKKIVVVIPARMGASRFPGKPLAKILDLPMVEHVRRRVLLSGSIDDAVVATCDQEIIETVQKYGGKAVMTANTHERCTDRVQEAAQKFDADIIVILQGDEPLFLPEVIAPLVQPMLEDEKVICTNLISKIKDAADLDDRDIVKAVLDKNQHVMYYSRSAIPFQRNHHQGDFYRQTGLSAFTKSFLNAFSNLPPTPLEKTESVDFLRILEHRYPILGVIFEQKTVGVDQKEHIQAIEEILRKDQVQNRLYQQILKA